MDTLLLRCIYGHWFIGSHTAGTKVELFDAISEHIGGEGKEKKNPTTENTTAAAGCIRVFNKTLIFPLFLPRDSAARCIFKGTSSRIVE